MLIRIGTALIPLTSILWCEEKGNEIVVHGVQGFGFSGKNVFVASGDDAKIIKAMVARMQKPVGSGTKAQNGKENS